ncbi:MAG: radical SAM protein [Nanoarchaeota archaeon]
MKVLLLFKPNPKIINIQQNIIPNGLLYIAALLLKNKIDVEILNLADKDWDESKDIIKNKNPDIVGVGCYTFNRQSCIKLAKIIKEIDKEIKVVFGGPHATIMFNQLIENYKEIDIIVINEGELTFLDIVNDKPAEKISGIVYRDGDKIIKNITREALANLDDLPIPAEYFRYKRIVTSRGCPGKCIYCDTPHLWGQKVRFRSADNVVDELDILNKKYGISSFIISDDTFTLDKQRTIDICKKIINRNLKITWDCRSRVNLICEERLRWMKKAGCVSISYGIESGSQKILDNLKKYINVDQIKKAAQITRKFGFNLNYFIIVGSPGEDDDTVRETMHLIKQTKPTSVFVYVMQLTPGTDIWKMTKNKGFLKESEWLNSDEETIFYTLETDIDILKKYVNYVEGFFKIFKKEFKYTEDELNDIIIEEKGVQDLINLANIKLSSGNNEKAEELIDEAIKLNHGSSEAMMIKGIILAMKRDDRCITYFNKALTFDPENLLAYINLGLYQYKQKRYDESICIFRKAIDIEPANIEFYNNLGSILGIKKEYKEAIAILKKALLIDPNNKETLRNLAITLENSNNIEKAEK